MMKNNLTASVILGLIVIGVYAPITILGLSYNPSTYTEPFQYPATPSAYNYHGKNYSFSYLTTIDPGASGEQTWPIVRLAGDLLSIGIIPLWNPYNALGTPLAADVINPIFSPITLVQSILPVAYWDFLLLLSVWLAGVFTFLFLRSINLRWESSLCGALFYMLSGSFTWYLPHQYVTTILFTPLILYSIEKVLQKSSLKYVILGSIAVCFSILGAHLESIILQFLLATSYFGFRFYPILKNYFKKIPRDFTLKSDNKIIGIVIFFRYIGIYLAGIGLSLFLILPVYEYIRNSTIAHSAGTGLGSLPSYTAITAFIPYFLGSVQSYWSPRIVQGGVWNALGGYVGIASLFFALIPLTFLRKNHNSHKGIYLFFLIIAIFSLLKSIGVPIINLIGYIPVLDHIAFTRYIGALWAFGFAVAASYGIDLLYKENLTIKKSVGVISVTFLTISLLSVLIYPYLENKATILYYLGFQLFQAILFMSLLFIIILRFRLNSFSILGIICLIILELSLYIPYGLPYVWNFYRSVITLVGAFLITALIFVPANFSYKFFSLGLKIKPYVVISVLIVTMMGTTLIIYLSPMSLPSRYDPYQESPPIKFLEDNVGNYRIATFDFDFLPNNNAVHKIQSVDIISSFNVDSFNSFVRNFLDRGVFVNVFGNPGWRMSDVPTAGQEFQLNSKFYDFVGVKYLVSSNTNPNNFVMGSPGGDASTLISQKENNTIQEFKSPFDGFDGIDIQLGTYGKKEHGKIILTLDSIPYNSNCHRESVVNAEDIIDGSFQTFHFPKLTSVTGKLFKLSLKFSPSDSSSQLAVFLYNGHQSPPPLNVIKELTGGSLILDGSTSNGILVFSINSDSYKQVFHFRNATIYENPAAFPRTFLVEKYTVVEPAKAQDFLLKHPDFDLRNNVIIEKLLPSDQIDLLKSCTLNKNSNTNIVSYSANKVAINTSSNCLSLLVLTDVYYPGWKATIDGNESHIYRADGLVRAIVVPQGNHTIVFSYMPPSFVVGLTITIITAGILIGFFVYSKRKEQINGSIQSS